jgi:hypothetical protein
MSKYLDLAGLTAYDTKIKEWIKSGLVDITDDEIRALFVTPILYQAVDLGLSVKWADRNVGAENPYDAGLYFSWGNVDGHAVDENGNVMDGYSFDEYTYPTTLGGQYKGGELDAGHDAATANIGEGWRMPTADEIDELVENTDHYYIGEDGSIVAGPFDYATSSSDKGLDGSKLRSICFVKNGEEFDYNNRTNFIELPFAGRCYESLLGYEGEMSDVWSSTAEVSFLKIVGFLSFGSDGSLDCSGGRDRYYGQSVRGVQV